MRLARRELASGKPDDPSRLRIEETHRLDIAAAAFEIDGELRQQRYAEAVHHRLFRLMSADQKRPLFHNIKAAIDGVPVEIVKRQVGHLYRDDPDYGIGVATRMGCRPAICPPRGPQSNGDITGRGNILGGGSTSSRGADLAAAFLVPSPVNIGPELL
jgi:hypothetical protein